MYYNDLVLADVWQIADRASTDERFSESERNELAKIATEHRALSATQSKISHDIDNCTDEDFEKYEDVQNSSILQWKPLQGNQGKIFWIAGGKHKFIFQGYASHAGYTSAAVGLAEVHSKVFKPIGLSQ
jgi:hypothetical protein